MVERMNTGSLLKAWEADQVAQGLGQRTIHERAQIVQRFAKHAGIAPEEATRDHLVDYLGRDYSAGTRVTYYSHLNAWFGWLQFSGHRGDNPAGTVLRPKSPRRMPHPVPNEGLTRLLESRMWPSTRAMILLGAYAGLRVHEIGKLRGEDIRDGELRVAGKGGRVDFLPVHPVLQDVADRMPHIGWWFPSPADARNHVASTSVSAVVSRAMARAGVDGTAHSLRHWFGTALVRAGVDLRTVQELLRHSSLATTAIYTAVDDGQRRAGVARLPGAMVAA